MTCFASAAVEPASIAKSTKKSKNDRRKKRVSFENSKSEDKETVFFYCSFMLRGLVHHHFLVLFCVCQ